MFTVTGPALFRSSAQPLTCTPAGSWLTPSTDPIGLFCTVTAVQRSWTELPGPTLTALTHTVWLPDAIASSIE